VAIAKAEEAFDQTRRAHQERGAAIESDLARRSRGEQARQARPAMDEWEVPVLRTVHSATLGRSNGTAILHATLFSEVSQLGERS
jgi:hypothetical protein